MIEQINWIFVNEAWEKCIKIDGIDELVLLDDFAQYPIIEFLIKYLIKEPLIEEKNFLLERYKELQEKEIDNNTKEIISYNLISALYWYKNYLSNIEEDLIFIDLTKILNEDKKIKKNILNLFKECLRLGVWKKNLMPKIYIEYNNLSKNLLEKKELEKYLVHNPNYKDIKNFMIF